VKSAPANVKIVRPSVNALSVTVLVLHLGAGLTADDGAQNPLVPDLIGSIYSERAVIAIDPLMLRHPILDMVAKTTVATDMNPPFAVGTKVYVRSQFIGAWRGGYVVAGVVDDGYLLWRFSDRHFLPDVFPPGVVRRERREHPLRDIEESYLDRRPELR
jgi:hypothetical protein